MLQFRATIVTFALPALALFAPSRAAAEDAGNAGDKAAAEALYQLGRQLMAEGKYGDACPKLAASNDLEPGVGTSLLLADCHEKAGKLASAWATFLEAAALAKLHADAERNSMAELRAAALRPRLTYVVFSVDRENEVDGFELRRSGVVVKKTTWGMSLPVDAGKYEVVASAPGRDTWRTNIDVPLQLSEPLQVRVPALRAASSADGAAAGSWSPAAARSPAHDREAPGGAQRTIAWVTMGAGAAALVATGVLGLLAGVKNDDSKDHCNRSDQNLCDPDGVALRDDSQKLATVATTVGIAGGVLAATGAVLYLTAPSDERGNVSGLTLGLRAGF